MKQEVDVMAVFKQGDRIPRPVRLRLIEGGKKLTIDIFQILGGEYIGTQRYDFDCNSLSTRGGLINYKLSYYRTEGRWVIDIS